MNKEDIQVGTVLMFNQTGGRCTGDLPLNTPLMIKSLSREFQSPGDCNATMDNGCLVRLSSVDNWEPNKDRYEKFFTIMKPAPNNYILFP